VNPPFENIESVKETDTSYLLKNAKIAVVFIKPYKTEKSKYKEKQIKTELN
jgi:hypothetical protein